ncbi:MAG TPA: hypothetical protein PL045_00630 [Chitinophagaceae bacterium]|nr:hypothetical protein [Chitinophagaceae bacterium]
METILISLAAIRDFFSNTRVPNSGILQLQSEMYDIDVPDCKVDRDNLKSDRQKVSTDYKKAFLEKELELQLDDQT